MKLSLLLSIFCLVFPKRALLTREFKVMLVAHERKLEPPALTSVINKRNEQAAQVWISNHEPLTENTCLKGFANAP